MGTGDTDLVPCLVVHFSKVVAEAGDELSATTGDAMVASTARAKVENLSMEEIMMRRLEEW